MIARGRAVPVVALAGLGAVVCAAASCQTDSSTGTCDLQQQVAQTGTALTLLPGARLDRVGNGFVLMGYDGRRVRWAPVSNGGQVGTEKNLELPSDANVGPWFAAAGRNSPGDSIVVAYGVRSGTSGQVDLQRIAVASSDGSTVATGLGPTVVDPATDAAAAVVMRSGRAGMTAGLAFRIPGQGQIQATSFTGDAKVIGEGFGTPGFGTSPLISCLSFVDGKNDLTVGFLSSASEDDPNPHWTVGEANDVGSLDSFVVFALGTARPSCPFTAVSGGGYVNVWQNELGSLIGVYDGKSQDFASKLFAGAVTFGGADAQPAIAGVAPLAGGDYAVVLARNGAAEAWRIQASDLTSASTVVLPSALGMLGQISTVASGGALYATYADYSVQPPAAAGQRIFVKVSCF